MKNLILIPTSDISCIAKFGDGLLFDKNGFDPHVIETMDLYEVVESNIKIGDYIYDKFANKVFQVSEFHHIMHYWVKVVSSTNSCITVPHLPRSFQKAFVDKYNLENQRFSYSDMLKAAEYGYNFHKNTQFPNQDFEDSCVNNTKQWLTTFSKDEAES